MFDGQIHACDFPARTMQVLPHASSFVASNTTENVTRASTFGFGRVQAADSSLLQMWRLYTYLVTLRKLHLGLGNRPHGERPRVLRSAGEVRIIDKD